MSREMEDYAIVPDSDSFGAAYSPKFFSSELDAIKGFGVFGTHSKCDVYIRYGVHCKLRNRLYRSAIFMSVMSIVWLIAFGLSLLKLHSTENEAIERGFAERDKTGAIQWKQHSKD